MSYGFGSWGFVGYALYKHLNRYEIAKKSIFPDKLTAHYMMHFIPDALDNLNDSDKSYHQGLNKFFVEKGIKQML